MNKGWGLFAFSIAFGLIGFIGLTPAQASSQAQECTGRFEGNVTSGPDTGLVLAGTITLEVDASGKIKGVLVQSDGSKVKVDGKFKNPEIKLTFDLHHASHITGVGQLPNGFTPCTSNFGGSFRGPRTGDHGEWGIIWGS